MSRDRRIARNSKNPRRKKRGGVRRLFNFLILLILGGVCFGFVMFAQHVDRLGVPSTIPKADGIVVWTGGGGGRLEMAGRLLSDDRGERLLISGVNDQVDRDDISALTGLTQDVVDCCVDLDYAALDTRGNARETAVWAQALGYEHILLVTSAYHMPRARVEIGREVGRIRITPIAVVHPSQGEWWRDKYRLKRLINEYGKYLFAIAQGRNRASTMSDLVLPNDVPREEPKGLRI